jgi:hypothetical protein
MPTTKKTNKASTRTSKKSTVAKKKPSAGSTKAQMRVTIAKDVLAQIAARRYRPQIGSWVDDYKLGGLDGYVDSKFYKAHETEAQSKKSGKNNCDIKVNAKEYLNKVTTCSVCALGAIFMSQVNTCGDVVFSEDSASPFDVFEDLHTSPLKKYFSVNQLMLIEGCFEGSSGAHECDITDGDARLLTEAYVFTYKTPTPRMVAIMTNIIRNKGNFVPSQDVTKEALIEAGKFYLTN